MNILHCTAHMHLVSPPPDCQACLDSLHAIPNLISERDELQAALTAAAEREGEKDKEIARLTACLQTANANHEEFERKWYLEGDAHETAKGLLRESAERETAKDKEIAGLRELLSASQELVTNCERASAEREGTLREEIQAVIDSDWASGMVKGAYDRILERMNVLGFTPVPPPPPVTPREEK